MLPSLPCKIGNYNFERIIGRGGYANVYEVENTICHLKYAGKVISLLNTYDVDAVYQQFSSEAACLQSLDHPNIVKIYDFFRWGDFLISILELCPNGALTLNEPLSIDDISMIFPQIVAGIAACHSKHLAHRDIKHSNILYNKCGRITITDFGLSSFFAQGVMTQELAGTLPYVAPEILYHKDHDPFAADCWSIGVLLYQMATGKLPWQFSSRAELTEQIKLCQYERPEGINENIWFLISNLLVFEPARRFTVKELMNFPITVIKKVHSNVSRIDLRPQLATRTYRSTNKLPILASNSVRKVHIRFSSGSVMPVIKQPCTFANLSPFLDRVPSAEV